MIEIGFQIIQEGPRGVQQHITTSESTSITSQQNAHSVNHPLRIFKCLIGNIIMLTLSSIIILQL